MSNTGRGNPACPYLGLEEDADTSLAFPSIWNTCHRGRRVVPPSLEHQAEYCLGENHRNCVAFPAEQATLPYHLRASHNNATRPKPSSHRGIALLFLGIVASIGLGWALLYRAPMLPALTEMPSLAVTALMTPTMIQTTVLTDSPTPIIIPVPNSTSNGTGVSNHGLEQPIGSDYQFVIHKIVYGENLNQCASRYNTSIDAIMAVNYDLKTPVWVDQLVIIPVGFTNVAGLPPFEAYEVPRANMSLKVLALGFGVSLKDLRYYNAVGMDESLQVGDWLLIPRPKPAP